MTSKRWTRSWNTRTVAWLYRRLLRSASPNTHSMLLCLIALLLAWCATAWAPE